ncbi:hypothetical protein [Bordetella genomosp. 5]|uniref:Uncharacterized protein n=1 Tax=Bordetella genomosp. 5 TaxID=1395608 RepID=A0A261TM23_9BORD|nr:hypothetical protein [Bordetella genomosp. 5]OZI50307.1 hypothetical protein CAL25_13410 [Bordetella genomosp. 5]
MTHSATEIVRPWYREPWPWILMAGPAAALIGCFATIYLAYTYHPDAPIIDGGVRRGLVVERHADVAPAGAPIAAPAPDSAPRR